MDRPEVVSREEWIDARRALLAEEKALTRARDVLNEQRRGLPMVRVGKEYRFEGPDGEVGLPDLFGHRGQLIVFHMMWRWDLDAGCPSCSFQVDNVGHLAHLHAAGTTLAVVTRGPWASVAAFRERMGWAVSVYSSFGSDFNYDFHVTLDEGVAPVEYNYRTKAEHEQAGMPWHTRGEQPGTSVFVRDGDDVFHTYSTYAARRRAAAHHLQLPRPDPLRAAVPRRRSAPPRPLRRRPPRHEHRLPAGGRRRCHHRVTTSRSPSPEQ